MEKENIAIEPKMGNYYKIKYISGTIYNNKLYETNATFIKKSSKNENYIFAIQMDNLPKFFIVYVKKENIIQSIDKIELENDVVNMLELFISKSKTFFTTSMNLQSHSCYIDFEILNKFIEEYYEPGKGDGYMEALNDWSSNINN